MYPSILIKDTTREQRIQIIQRSLNVGGDACEECGDCGGQGTGDAWDMYQPYIDGKKEIQEINAEYRAHMINDR